MWSKSKIAMVGPLAILVGGLTANILTAGSAPASDIEKICAQAEDRYAEMFPDTKEEPGIAVVKMYKYTFLPTDPDGAERHRGSFRQCG